MGTQSGASNLHTSQWNCAQNFRRQKAAVAGEPLWNVKLSSSVAQLELKALCVSRNQWEFSYWFWETNQTNTGCLTGLKILRRGSSSLSRKTILSALWLSCNCPSSPHSLSFFLGFSSANHWWWPQVHILLASQDTQKCLSWFPR